MAYPQKIRNSNGFTAITRKTFLLHHFPIPCFIRTYALYPALCKCQVKNPSIAKEKSPKQNKRKEQGPAENHAKQQAPVVGSWGNFQLNIRKKWGIWALASTVAVDQLFVIGQVLVDDGWNIIGHPGWIKVGNVLAASAVVAKPNTMTSARRADSVFFMGKFQLSFNLGLLGFLLQ